MQYYREFASNRLIMFLIGVLVVSFIGVASTPGGLLTLLAVLSGIVLFAIVEYIVHRFLLHEFPKLMPEAYKGHVAHHEHPNDTEYLFGPVRYDFVGYILLIAILWAATGSLHMASSVILGTSICQLYYQWKHFMSHQPIVPLTPWGKWIKKAHLLHHYQNQNYWYGVSNPVIDMLMGTYLDKRSRQAASLKRDLSPAAGVNRDTNINMH